MSKKKETTPKGKGVASDNTDKSNDSISEAGTKVKKNLTMESSVKTIAIKCYDEQLGMTWDEFKKIAERIDKSGYEINSIAHDDDFLNNDVFDPDREKTHYHILMRTRDNTARKVKTYLKMLQINFRPGLDDDLFKKDGVTTVGSWARYSLYLIHGTEEAIKDGKKPYRIEDIVSNSSYDELVKLLGGEKHRVNGIKMTNDLGDELAKEAYEVGKNLKDFDVWFDELPYNVRIRNSDVKEWKRMYNRGMEETLTDPNKTAINKLCIFISGPANVGKSYASRYALGNKKILDVSGLKTGKFDSLNSSIEAIMIDDDTSSNLLQLCDNRICKMYRRSSDNRLFCGDTVIVTSNLTFFQWYCKCNNIVRNEECDLRPEEKDTYEATKSRFYVCRVGMSCKSVGKRVLKVDSPSTRGTKDDQLSRKKRFLEFRKLFEESLNSYAPVDNEVDYNDLDEAYLNNEDEYKEACDIVKASELVCGNKSIPDELKSIGAELKRMRDRVKLSVYDEYIAHIKTSILFYEQKFEGDMSISEYVELDKNNPFKDEETVA